MNEQTPQLKYGFIQIANTIVEALAKTQLNGYESRYIWALFRKTYGWNKKEDWISQTQIANMTGLHRQHVWRTEKALIERNIVTKLGYKVSFQKDFTRWRMLPKLVTSKSVTKLGTPVTKSGTVVTKNGSHKIHYTKNTSTKDIITSNNREDPEVTQIISYAKEKLGLPILDGSIKENRRYAHLALKKFGGVDKVKLIVDAAILSEFWSTRLSSMKTLYNNGVSIISSARSRKYGVTKL